MKPTARLATADDIPEVVRLRRVLFDSLGANDPGWELRCAEVLRGAMLGGSMVVVVVEAPSGEGLAAVGSGEIQQRLPGPRNPTGLLGYIGTMATDPQWRRRGMARAVLRLLLHELARRGVDRVELHATSEAESLYRSVGFAERPGGLEMRLLDA
jgi:ribosomal protein S18 acetylase RimI-like enzyme